MVGLVKVMCHYMYDVIITLHGVTNLEDYHFSNTYYETWEDQVTD
jgi:hypothetical protein